MPMIFSLRSLRKPARDKRGLALTEFAFALPVLLLLGLTGAEFANFITTKMRISQIALQVADNAARMGTGTETGPKTISEAEMNDVFTGGQLESGLLDLKTNGRVIVSDLEPMPKPNTDSKYQIVWQRCYGNATHPSQYGNWGDQKIAGIGPAGSMVTAQPDNATIFVEVYYEYKPLLGGKLIPQRFLDQFKVLDEIASMAVRDQRYLKGDPNLSDDPAKRSFINPENVAKSAC